MVTIVITSFLAGVIRKPLLCIAILLLCFPASGIIWVGLAAIIGAAIPVPAFLLDGEEAASGELPSDELDEDDYDYDYSYDERR